MWVPKGLLKQEDDDRPRAEGENIEGGYFVRRTAAGKYIFSDNFMDAQTYNNLPGVTSVTRDLPDGVEIHYVAVEYHLFRGISKGMFNDRAKELKEQPSSVKRNMELRDLEEGKRCAK